MKPRNKFQKRVVELSQKLAQISEWTYKNCFEHIGRRTAKGIVTCLDCGHSWKGEGELSSTLLGAICPHCNTKLNVKTTRKRLFKDNQYLCIVTTCGEFQVLRFVYLDYSAKVGEKAKYFHSEVVQKWLAPSGKCVTMARLKPFSFYCDSWSFHTDLEVRHDKVHHNVMPTKIYPYQRLIPEIKQSGYSKEFYGLTPYRLFQYILDESRAETLLKAGKIALLCYFAHNQESLSKYWSSIKICLRNNYEPSDISIWTDYIDLLRFFGKDLHNAKFVCADNLRNEHDKYVERKRRLREKQEKIEKRKKALEDKKRFEQLRSKFFGICFTDGLLQVAVLDSVEAVMEEGDAMHHCVFENNYHLKENSLILSACFDGEKVETVEFSLSEMMVVQSRGLQNKNTDYHDRIINLVNSNKHLIQKCITA